MRNYRLSLTTADARFVNDGSRTFAEVGFARCDGRPPLADDKEEKRATSPAITSETIQYYSRRARRLRAESFFDLCKGLARKVRWLWRR